MSPLPKPSAVLFVADVVKVTQFYQALASMAFVHGDDQHSVLEVCGFQLVIHALRGAPKQGDPEGNVLQVRQDAG